jgi:hypothetical protein
LQLVKAQNATCADTLDTAQACVKECVDLPSLNTDRFDSIYGNLLTECVDQENVVDRAEQLQTCCKMASYDDLTCDTSMQDAQDCLIDELSDIKTTAVDYLSCIYSKRNSGDCPFANFCIGILAGGYDVGWENDNDFAVGNESNLAEIARNALTCDDMNDFGRNTCTTMEGCCKPCADKIAGVVNAVMDKLILPTYSILSDCGGNKTCDDYTNTTERRLEDSDGSLVGTTIINADDSILAAELAGECNDALVDEIVLFNKTYAATNFMECLYKKMGKIIAATEPATLEMEESSSISVSLGATSTTLFMIASTVYVIVA